MQLFKNVGGVVVSLNVDLVQKNQMLQGGWSIETPEIPYAGSADASGKASASVKKKASSKSKS